jgi:hypothetical protein
MSAQDLGRRLLGEVVETTLDEVRWNNYQDLISQITNANRET